MKRKNSMRWHTKKKLKRRYGIFASNDVYFAIQDAVKRQEGKILEKQSNTRLLIKLVLPKEIVCQDKRTCLKVPAIDGCITLYLVYNTKYKELNTALPWAKSEDEFLKAYHNGHRYERI